jgi:hypothetical protein
MGVWGSTILSNLYIIYILLVGGLEHEFYFSIYWNVIIPTDELICFRGVETTNQIIYIYICILYTYRGGLANAFEARHTQMQDSVED